MAQQPSDECFSARLKELCLCYVSEPEEPPKTNRCSFTAATKHGPTGIHERIHEKERDIIRELISDQPVSSLSSRACSAQTSLYTGLKQGEIRVLELQPAKFDEPLKGCLHVVRIDFEDPLLGGHRRTINHAVSIPQGEPVWYTALSYTWGAPVFEIDFSFGELGEIKITRGLASVLNHLRDEHESVFLWIDQICINQSSVKEKEHQIPLMNLIYSHATSTVIWLGDGDHFDARMAFDMLQKVLCRLHRFEGTVDIDDFERLGFPTLYPMAAPPEWRAVLTLFRSEWFSRLWIIQEAVLSRNLYVKFGKAVVAWDDFTLWCKTMHASEIGEVVGRNQPPRETRFGLLTVLELSQFRTLRHLQEKRSSLLDALVMSRYANASNPKDKIYGVLGMAPTAIQPRYSDSVQLEDVLLEAALAIMPSDLFRLLCCAESEVPNRPSRVPNWSSKNLSKPLGFATEVETVYSAGIPSHMSSASATLTTTYVLGDGNLSLTISGVNFDTIESLGNIMHNPFIHVYNDTHLRDQTWVRPGTTVYAIDDLSKLIKMVEQIRSYPSGDSAWDAFWHTIVAGKDGSSNGKAPPEYSEVMSLLVDEISRRKTQIAGQPCSSQPRNGDFTVESLTTGVPRKFLNDLIMALHVAADFRKFAITQKGYFCLVPGTTRSGDMIAVFEGAPVPFVVRKTITESGTGFELVGEAYVHGIMQGEIFDMYDIEFDSLKLV